MNLEKAFSSFASKAARATGSPWAFCLCVVMVVVWAASGPVFKFSETWQLVINTGTTIITFLMVFLIQNTQNRDGMAIQTKLDELILTSRADNEYIGIEEMTDKELEALHVRCKAHAEQHSRMAKDLGAEISKRRTRKKRKAA